MGITSGISSNLYQALLGKIKGPAYSVVTTDVNGLGTGVGFGTSGYLLASTGSTSQPTWVAPPVAPGTEVARYVATLGQSIPYNANTVINYDTMVYDPHGTVTTGASWTFTAPATGYYQVNASFLFAGATWSVSTYWSLYIYVNGSVYSSPNGGNVQAAAFIGVEGGGGDIIQMTMGDTLNVQIIQTGTGGAIALNTYQYANYISIALIGGSGGGGTIGGTIATNQVAVGSGTNTIAGSSGLTYNGSLLSLTGGETLTGLLQTAASTTGGAGLNLPQGTAPTSPNNGDEWMTSSGLFYHAGGTTVGPLGAGTVTGGSSEGSGSAVFDATNSTASTLFFKSLIAGSNITLTPSGTAITIASTASGSGTVTGGSNEGGGTYAVFDSVNSTSSTLVFKTINSGSGITITDSGTLLTIAATGGGGGIGGSITSGQVAYGDVTANTIAGSSSFTYNSGSSTVTIPSLVTTGGSNLFANNSTAVNIGSTSGTNFFLNIVTNTGAGAMSIQAIQASVGDTLLQLNPGGGTVTAGALFQAPDITATSALISQGTLEVDGGSHLFANDGSVAVNIGNTGTFGLFTNFVTDTSLTANAIQSIQANNGPVSLLLNPSGGSVAIGSAALSTSTTAGFLYIPSCAGVPTGTPVTMGSCIPVVYNSSSGGIYFYNGSWSTVGGIGGSITANQVAYGSGTATITGSGNFTYNGSTVALTTSNSRDLMTFGSTVGAGIVGYAGFTFQSVSTDRFGLVINATAAVGMSGGNVFFSIYDSGASADIIRFYGSGGIGSGATAGGSAIDIVQPTQVFAALSGASQFNAVHIGAPTVSCGTGSNLDFSIVLALDAPAAAGTNVTITTGTASLTAAGSVVVSSGTALSTSATNGFLYIPTCAGTPTGTPEAWPAAVPLVYDTTSMALYVYTGGSWITV
jgi:hypothetical protein